MTRAVWRIFFGVVLIVSTSLNVSAKTFSDIPPNYWAEKKISALVKDNVITGYPDGTFKPNQPVTKAEFDTMLSRALSLEINKNGCATPDRNITRAEAVRIALSVVGTEDLSESAARNYISIYKDAGKIPGWAVMPVAKAQRQYVISTPPTVKKYFNPSKLITRAEAAVLLYNIKEKNPVHVEEKTQETPSPLLSEGIQLENAQLEENGIIAVIPEGTVLEGLYTDDPIKRRKSSLKALFVITTQTNYVTKQNYLLLPAFSNISGEITNVKPIGMNSRRIVMNGAEVSELSAQIYTAPRKRKKFIINKDDTVYVKLTKPVRVDVTKTTILR